MRADISLIASSCIKSADCVNACYHVDVIRSLARINSLHHSNRKWSPIFDSILWESSFTTLTCLLFSALSVNPKGVTAIAVSFYSHYLSHLCVTKSFQYHTQVIVVRLKHRHKYYMKHLIHEA